MSSSGIGTCYPPDCRVFLCRPIHHIYPNASPRSFYLGSCKRSPIFTGNARDAHTAIRLSSYLSCIAPRGHYGTTAVDSNVVIVTCALLYKNATFASFPRTDKRKKVAASRIPHGHLSPFPRRSTDVLYWLCGAMSLVYTSSPLLPLKLYATGLKNHTAYPPILCSQDEASCTPKDNSLHVFTATFQKGSRATWLLCCTRRPLDLPPDCHFSTQLSL